MALPTEADFLKLLADALMYTAKPLEMDAPFPAMVYDSTGAMMVSMAIEEKFGMTISLDTLLAFDKPREIYGCLAQQN